MVIDGTVGVDDQNRGGYPCLKRPRMGPSVRVMLPCN